MNGLKIKVNGTEISLENGKAVVNNAFNPEAANIDQMSAALSVESDNLSKTIKAVELLSDVKTVESFGYRSLEGIGQNIANAAKGVWQKIVDFIKKIINFITSLVQGGIIQAKAKMLQKKVQSAAFFAADVNTKVEWPRIEAKIVKGYVQEASKSLDTLAAENANNEAFTKVYEAAKQFASGQNTDVLPVVEVLAKLGVTGVGESDNEAGIDTATASKVNELLNSFASGQISYINDLKEANEASKKALKAAEKCASEGGDGEKVKAANAAVQVINNSVKMYTAYANGVLKAIGALYSYSTTAKPGTEEFKAWLAKLTDRGAQ